jgi:hypothetical protein
MWDSLMARYFFDSYDNGRLTADRDGLECASREALRYQATKTLPHMALDALPNGPEHEFAIVARDEAGQQVFRATLSFQSEWLGE